METIVEDVNHMQKFAKKLIIKIKDVCTSVSGPIFVGFSGDLGAGKTTLTRYAAEYLGVFDYVISPTFVLRVDYETKDDVFKKLIHIDAYRFEDPEEVKTIGWNEIMEMNDTLVIIEWPEQIKHYIPEDACFIKIVVFGEKRKITHPFAL